MTMCATVLRVQNGELLVCDHCTHQRIVVHSLATSCFQPGDRVRIEYDGAMTRSIPPQLTAQHVCRICH